MLMGLKGIATGSPDFSMGTNCFSAKWRKEVGGSVGSVSSRPSLVLVTVVSLTHGFGVDCKGKTVKQIGSAVPFDSVSLHYTNILIFSSDIPI